MLIEYMERCHDCWLWTNREYVGFSVCLILNVSLIAWYTMHHDTRAFTHSTVIELHTTLCWCWLYIWNGVMMTLDEQGVRWYCCMFEFECVITCWYMMQNDTDTVEMTHSSVIWIRYNDNDIRLCADIDWIYGTVSCWLWTNRWYVGIVVCLNLNVSLIA